MNRTQIIDSNEIAAITDELCQKLLDRHPDTENFTLIGIQRRGADLAARIAAIIAKHGKKADLGKLDINLYRDDWTIRPGAAPAIGKSEIPFSLDNRKIILVDDVLFTGRTIRAALEALFDYGRPDSVELLVLIDRACRELPISADYIGKVVPTGKHGYVDVLLKERDGQDGAFLTTPSS